MRTPTQIGLGLLLATPAFAAKTPTVKSEVAQTRHVKRSKITEGAKTAEAPAGETKTDAKSDTKSEKAPHKTTKRVTKKKDAEKTTEGAPAK